MHKKVDVAWKGSTISFMKTKPAKLDEKPKERPAPAANPSDSAVTEEKVNRLSFPIDENGNPQWDKMQAKTREKVKALMGERNAAPVAEKTIEVFDPAWTSSLYDIIGKVESFAAQKMYKFPPDIAEMAFTYSPAEKEKLAGPTAKVINKYAPEWLEKFKDEIALAGLFVTITAIKFQMASMLIAQSQKAGALKPQAPTSNSAPKTVDVSGLPSSEDLDIVTAERKLN